MEKFTAPSPLVREFAPLENSWEDMIRTEGVIKVDISPETKTSYNVTIQCGNCRHKINIDTQLEGLKYHKRKETSMWTMNSYTAYYLKAKKISDLVKHTEFILNKWWGELFKEYPTKLVFHRTSAFLQLTQDEQYPEYRSNTTS